MPASIPPHRLTAGALLVVIAAALGGCETTGPAATDAAAKPVQEPMTRTRAARECWMGTEKGRAATSLEKRAAIVDKCIDEKLKATPAAPAS